MPRRAPFSGKQKKQRLQEKKARQKKDGPKYLADWSDDETDDDESEKKEVCEGGATKRGPFNTDVESERMNAQPERKSKVSVNNFRLQFRKEPDDVIDKRKKEARRAVKRLNESGLEYSVEDAYPTHCNLDFPKRPAWSYKISKQHLEKQEKEYFQTYLNAIISQPQSKDLSYFELNLENWRQLWRVMEISDVLLIIADIRYPVLHVSPSLLQYIRHILRKPVILIINKIDFVPSLMAVAWRRYLQQQFPGIHIVFFSSSVKKICLSGKQSKGGSGSNDKDVVGGSDEDDVPLDFDPSKAMFKRPAKGSTVPLGPTELYRAVLKIVQDKVDLSSWRQHLEEEGVFQSEDKAMPDVCGDGRTGGDTDMSGLKREYQDGVVTLGCIGYPNVGKSSVLNAIKGKKVVSVSQTPGHTKHFQTIFLTPTVKLCDCPGLVFPSVVPKALQVIAGIFPVSQVREPYSVVQYVAERMDLPALLKIRRPPDCDDGDDYQWSAFDICEAWAIKCGFFTAKASRPDLYRAANNILRMTVSGQIRLCFRPPEYSGNLDELRSDPETHSLHRQLKARVRLQAEGGESVDGEEDDHDDDGEEDDDDKEDDHDDDGGDDISNEEPEEEEDDNGSNNNEDL